ncbi:MAG TPA: flagellar basal body rod protein FlgG [Calditerricola sp.]
MLRALYSGVSGMRQFQLKLDVIGNNIANVNTVGFKKGRVLFQDILSQTVSGASIPEDAARGGTNPRQIGLGVTTGAIDTVFTPGSPMTTNVPTDLYINGDGFFVLTPYEDGPVYLTRNGSFHVDSLGYLVNAQGLYVMGTGGLIQIDPETYTSFTISPNGEIIGVLADGTNEVIDTIQLAKIPNPAGLKKVGDSLYEVTPNAIAPDTDIEDYYTTPNNAEDGTGAVIAGMLEMSNVDLTEEFTEMIISQRGFQANARIITTSDEILQEVVNLKR